MAATLERLGIDRMSVAERLSLADEIWQSVEREIANEPLSAELAAELDRRVKAAEADPSSGIPWEVVKAEALARIRR